VRIYGTTAIRHSRGERIGRLVRIYGTTAIRHSRGERIGRLVRTYGTTAIRHSRGVRIGREVDAGDRGDDQAIACNRGERKAFTDELLDLAGQVDIAGVPTIMLTCSATVTVVTVRSPT
jgi:hypothetical protein